MDSAGNRGRVRFYGSESKLAVNEGGDSWHFYATRLLHCQCWVAAADTWQKQCVHLSDVNGIAGNGPGQQYQVKLYVAVAGFFNK